MKQATPKQKLKALENRLLYGAKSEIARRTNQNKHNIQTAFRGLAGDELTLIVLREAKKLPKKFLKPERKQALSSKQ